MKIRAIRPFRDYKENKDRQAGEEWEVTKERFDELKSNLFNYQKNKGMIIQEYVEEVVKEKKETKKETKKK